jgi:acid stress-induced BolA-like protein IbaG/YrbA
MGYRRSITIGDEISFLSEQVSMVRLEDVEALIKAQLPDAQVAVEDMKGGGDHLQVTVVSAAFVGQSRVRQHQMVYAAVQSQMLSNEIHAMALKTYTPETWSAEHPSS